MVGGNLYLTMKRNKSKRTAVAGRQAYNKYMERYENGTKAHSPAQDEGKQISTDEERERERERERGKQEAQGCQSERNE